MSNKDIIATVYFFFEWLYRRLEDDGLVVGLYTDDDGGSHIEVVRKHVCIYGDCGCDTERYSLKQALNHPKGRKAMIEWIFNKYETADHDDDG